MTRRTAKKLARLYQTYMMEKSISNMTKGRRMLTEFTDLGLADQKSFMKAAKLVLVLEAKPRDFIVAQFQAFDHYARIFGRIIVPQPSMLSSLGAQARYIQWQLQEREYGHRDSKNTEQVIKGSYREDRKLAGLARMTRLTPSDVLVERPEEFSEEYLKAKGVWPLVADLHRERNAS